MTVRPEEQKQLLLDNENDSIDNEDPLRQYVVKPSENKDTIAFVARDAGQIALTQYGDEPQLLGPGRHVLLSPWNELLAVVNETDQVIRHGPIFIIKVKRGELGYGVDLNDGHPILLSQGKHIIRSNTFVWNGFITLRDRRTRLDQIEVIRVEMGWVGYCFRAGNLTILEPGLHLITPPDRFGDFLSTQLSILDLPEGVHDTSDYVPLAIKAAVFYRVIDPRKALLNIQNIQQQIIETSVATLAGIIRSSSLSDVASRSQPFYNDPKKKGESKDPESKEEETHQYGQHIDEFITLLHDHVLNSWGIEIQNIRYFIFVYYTQNSYYYFTFFFCFVSSITNCKKTSGKFWYIIFGSFLDDNIFTTTKSAQAIDVSKQHNRFIMLQKQQAIVTVEAETRATQTRIDTEAEIIKHFNTITKIDSVVIKAKAEKEALRLKGLGEKDYAR
ncbi:hypothetical protein RFI_13233 [Reticulomyxa filosa]|uniref:Band 7 domain-containing protein n=1 Tax=Reticulomyxa filosa TaxID=46433 RepID=X6NDG6_RETFI|nr:hypothetical protein RFI_13233 [Reticulomyxa filosa]|eukprot:ETO23928.1 hypothetical protein RFI_13233 [Reticulomyxa filosa]